jgi:hypothetical protein
VELFHNTSGLATNRCLVRAAFPLIINGNPARVTCLPLPEPAPLLAVVQTG